MPSVARLALVNAGRGFVPFCRWIVAYGVQNQSHGLQCLGFVLVAYLAAGPCLLLGMLSLFPESHGFGCALESCLPAGFYPAMVTEKSRLWE